MSMENGDATGDNEYFKTSLWFCIIHLFLTDMAPQLFNFKGKI